MSYDPATYVEEIPVKISEKYRPPRKVTLSPLCNYQINSEVLTSEYDLTREYEMLKWIQNLKIYKDDKIKFRKEKIKQYEEEKEEQIRIEEEKLEQKRKEEEEKKEEEEEEERKKIEENKLNEKKNEEIEISDGEAKVVRDETCDKEVEECDEKASNNHDLSTQPQNSEFVVDIEENSPIEADQSKINPRQDPLDGSLHIYNPNMPTVAVSQTGIARRNNSQSIPPQVNVHNITYPPMLIPTQCLPQLSHQKSPTKTRCNINFADFEGDATDPFDNASLKSINDMEELAKILQSSNVKQKPHNQNFPLSQSRSYLNGGYSYSPYSYVNFPDSTLPPNNPSLFNQISSYQPKSSSSSASTVPLAGKSSSSSFENEKFLVDKQYPQWNQFGPNNTNNALSESSSSQYKPYNYLLPHNVMSSSSNSNVGSSEANVVVTRSLNNGSFQHCSSGVNDIALSKRPDLEDFYTRYYANTKKPLSGARSGESTPINHQTSKSSLPSSNSVPDLTAGEDNEVSKIISNNQFENAVSPYKNRPSRPYSTSGYEVLQNKTLTKPSTNTSRKRLPDPFTQLTEDAQTMVQNMSEMGFPRDRVARAVQKLGIDHKNLPEVLLTLQSFQEQGEDAYLSEQAFYYYMGDVEKVAEFLSAAKTLLDLGFEEEKVMENLFKNNNDKEKCLEELIAPEED